MIAYLQDDQTAQQREIQWFAGKREEYLSLSVQAQNALVHGQRSLAKDLNRRAAEVGRLAGDPSAPPARPTFMDAQAGDCAVARRGKFATPVCPEPAAVRIAKEKAAKFPPPNPNAGPLLYRRGLDALEPGKGAEAAAAFQGILDHKGQNWGPVYSSACLGLARAEAMLGDTAKAKRAYQQFLALWKDADRDLPFYIQATQELAALR
jgi:hypothetical protein